MSSAFYCFILDYTVVHNEIETARELAHPDRVPRLDIKVHPELVLVHFSHREPVTGVILGPRPNEACTVPNLDLGIDLDREINKLKYENLLFLEKKLSKSVISNV